MTAPRALPDRAFNLQRDCEYGRQPSACQDSAPLSVARPATIHRHGVHVKIARFSYTARVSLPWRLRWRQPEFLGDDVDEVPTLQECVENDRV